MTFLFINLELMLINLKMLKMLTKVKSSAAPSSCHLVQAAKREKREIRRTVFRMISRYAMLITYTEVAIMSSTTSE